ncbi:MAG: tyrosine-type recombinase/integrase [Treponema sp.]|nr:tyrosine-type recombinase/integrase [Spirochaetales bacterium]MDY4902910.1 tyrosine-type recombinase/integrase [Treponema sp.]
MESENVVSLETCIDEFLVYIESVRCLSPNTVSSYREDFHHLTLCLEKNIPVKNITAEDLRNCIASLSKRNYSVLSINRFISAVRSLFAYCKRYGYIPFNFALEIKTLRAPACVPRYMSPAEIDGICNAAQENPLLWGARDKAIFEMFYSSGCRVSEMTSLELNDFREDFSSAVVTGKGRKDRIVYFEKDAREALFKYLYERKKRFPVTWFDGACPVNKIFVNQKGNALSQCGIRYIVSSYSGPEGINHHVSPHAFRHTFATAMLANGADIRVVQEMLGHNSISTTQRYTHLTTQQLKDIYFQSHPHSGE